MGISAADAIGGQGCRHHWDSAGIEQPDRLLDLLDAPVESHDAEQAGVTGGQRDDHPGDGNGVLHLRAAVGDDHLEHRARLLEREFLGDHQAFQFFGLAGIVVFVGASGDSREVDEAKFWLAILVRLVCPLVQLEDLLLVKPQALVLERLQRSLAAGCVIGEDEP